MNEERFKFTDQLEIEVGKPTDYSFKEMRKLEPLGIIGAKQSRIGVYPAKSDNQKFLTRAVWLNNNKLKNMNNLDVFLDSVLEDPKQLAWIDFSHNNISHIDNILLQYPNLKIIYLHGNEIEDIFEVEKLAELKHLRSITLHGNPVSENSWYRKYMIAMLPQVKNLDFGPIVKSERLMPKPPVFNGTSDDESSSEDEAVQPSGTNSGAVNRKAEQFPCSFEEIVNYKQQRANGLQELPNGG